MAHVPNSAEQYEKMIGTPIPQLVGDPDYHQHARYGHL